MTPTTSLALIVLALGRASLLASGEIFHLDNKPIPGPYSLQGLSAFTVYVPPDGPTAQAGDSPYVEFKGVQAHSTDPSQSDDALANYGSIQLSLISMDDYDKHISKGPVCDFNDQLSSGEASMSKYTVGFTKTQFMHFSINKTGVYYLLMSNCGNLTLGEISGQVAVRNPFGFMSGTEYHKLSFYSYTTVLYMALALIWGMLCLTWRQEFIAIHAIVGLVIGLKVLECVSWTVHLYTMNLTGTASNQTVCILVMLTTLTSYTSYTFILVISQGWRMTEEVLEDCMLAKMGLFGLFWVVANYLREGAMVHRQTFHISNSFMTTTAVGSMITNGIIFIWVLMSLARLSKNLKERNLEDQLKAVSRFTVALMIAVVGSIMVALLQLVDNMGSLEVSWKYQYLADGGISQVIFACVVVVAMWVWMPSAGSGQLGYAAPAGQNEEDGLWKEDGIDDAEENGGNKIAPATLGAADEDL
jgi:hypothetical protein